MTTATHAALDAAILKYGGDAATSYEFHASVGVRRMPAPC